MAVPKLNNVYVGERYIPKWEGPWDSTKDYEGLCIVSYNNASYVSRRPVPAGTALDNETYWALMSNFGGQLQVLQEQVDAIQQQIDDGEIGGGSWTSAESLGIKPGIDIGTVVNTLPSDVVNIAFPAGTYTVDTACTFNVPVYFAPGALISYNANVTFTKDITAGRTHCFMPGPTAEPANAVSIPNTIVFPEWFGWMPTGTANIAGAIRLFKSITDACVSFGTGFYNAGGTQISFNHNLIIRGVSQDLTKVTLNLAQTSVDFLCLEDVHLTLSKFAEGNCTYFYAGECLFECSDYCVGITTTNSFEMENCDTIITSNSSTYVFFAGLINNAIMRVTNSTFTDNTTATSKNIFSIGKSTSVPQLVEFVGCSFSSYASNYITFFNLDTQPLGKINMVNCHFDILNDNATAPIYAEYSNRAYYSVVGCTGIMPKFPATLTSLSDCIFTVLFQEDLGARFQGKATNCVFMYPLKKFITNVRLAGIFVGCTFLKENTASNSLFPSDDYKASLISCITDSFNGLSNELTLIDTPVGTGIPAPTGQNVTTIEFLISGNNYLTYTSCGFLLVPSDTISARLRIKVNGVTQNIISATATSGNTFEGLDDFGGISGGNTLTFTPSQIGQSNFKVLRIAYGQELNPEYVTVPVKVYNSLS